MMLVNQFFKTKTFLQYPPDVREAYKIYRPDAYYRFYDAVAREMFTMVRICGFISCEEHMIMACIIKLGENGEIIGELQPVITLSIAVTTCKSVYLERINRTKYPEIFTTQNGFISGATIFAYAINKGIATWKIEAPSSGGNIAEGGGIPDVCGQDSHEEGA